jgi:hypothetical protein
VSTCEQCREGKVDDTLLTENDAADLSTRSGDALQRHIGVAGQLAWIGDIGHAHQLVLCATPDGLQFCFVFRRIKLNTRHFDASPKRADVRFAHKETPE